MADQDPTTQSNQAVESRSSSGPTQAAAVDLSPTTTDPSSSSSPSPSPSPASPRKKCSHCSKAAASSSSSSSSSASGEGEKEGEKEGGERPLKPCTKCQSVQYCSRDCQKADFKRHKRECARAAQVYAQRADIRMAVPGRAPREGFRGGLQKWQFDT